MRKTVASEEQNSEADDSTSPPPADDYPWASDADERRRAFVISTMANADIEGTVLVSNMHAVYEWLRIGKLPAAKGNERNPIRSLSGAPS